MILPRVTVIILNWNGRDILPLTLPSVVATEYPNLEVVVADNASTDGSPAWIEANFPQVRLIRHMDNLGFCRGNNEAIRQTSGPYVVLLNSDVEVSPDWLRPLVTCLEAHADVAAVQPKLLQYKDRTQFEYAGGSGGFLDRWGYPFTRGRLFFTLEEDHGQYDDARPIVWASGAAVLLRRSALESVGLLDETFFLHMEEIDLCWRLARAGYRIMVEPASRVFHIGGSSLPQGDARKTYYNFRNNLLMLYKNLPPAAWRRTFPIRILFDSAAVCRSLLLGNVGEAFAILRAYADAHVLKTRYRSFRPSAAEAAAPLWYRRSVVIDYFLRRKRTFSSLPAEAFLQSGASSEIEPGGRSG